MPELFSNAHVYSSCGSSEATGGVLTVVSDKILKPGSIVRDQALCKGRVLLVTIDFGGAQVFILNVHNFGLTAADARSVVRRMQRPIALAKRFPDKY